MLGFRYIFLEILKQTLFFLIACDLEHHKQFSNFVIRLLKDIVISI